MYDTVPSGVGRSAELLITPHGGGAEALFRLGAISAAPDRTAAASMPVGPWLLDDGRPAAGSLCVLVDVVLGQAVIVARPPGHWAVTTELAVDFCAPVPPHGRLHATAEALAVDGAGGYARAAVHDDGGRPVAFGAAWQRFVPTVPDTVTSGTAAPDPGQPPPHELLETDGDALLLGGRPEFANPSGVVHGGVLAWAAERAAHRLAARPDLDSAALRVQYIRPAHSPIACVPRVVHGGRTFVVVEVELRGRDARPCTRASVTLRAASLD